MYNYNWLDISPMNGNNYYRIRMLEQSGAVAYSQMILIKTGSNINAINISPNTIEGNLINLQFNKQVHGLYKIRLLNVIGQTMDATEIKVNSNGYTESFVIKPILTQGIYQVEIVTPENKKIVKKVMVK